MENSKTLAKSTVGSEEKIQLPARDPRYQHTARKQGREGRSKLCKNGQNESFAKIIESKWVRESLGVKRTQYMRINFVHQTKRMKLAKRTQKCN
jgi:hypothetical protein